jgi:nucleotide-binding universal stress UspA family protein
VASVDRREDAGVGTGVAGQRARIVVAVDDSRAARNAVLWGAAAARLHGRDLIIAHVAPPGGRHPPDSDAAAAREHLLNASAAAASQREPTVVVGTQLLFGVAAEELVRLTNAAMMLVVGVDVARPRSDHGALGSLEDRVVVHARCPVVTVSHPPRVGHDQGATIVAVWTSGTTSRQVLQIAALEATLLSGSLSVIAGALPDRDGQWPMPSSYEGSLARELGELATLYPQLHSRVTRVTDHLAEAVGRASVDADLVVMAGDTSEDRWSIRTGLLAETAMRETVCPTLFINAATQPWDAARILTTLAASRRKPSVRSLENR